MRRSDYYINVYWFISHIFCHKISLTPSKILANFQRERPRVFGQILHLTRLHENSAQTGRRRDAFTSQEFRRTYPCLSRGRSTSTRSADPRAVLISNGNPRLRPPGFFGASWPPFPPLFVPFPPSRFSVIFGRARPPPEMSHATVRRREIPRG